MVEPIDRSDDAYGGWDEPGSAEPNAREGRISDAMPRVRVIVVNANPVTARAIGIRGLVEFLRVNEQTDSGLAGLR